ncbi:50S ribosomal protein L17 [Candidatus Kaiserbacteria bacterium RIFCSPHIGHO2_01_FULL_50_13]|uniref:50S ribosomal protein L17 n=1 Tax=Candidatus Kaiserbacteria bacterium RIFCSPLOWO2_01_FULL_50_24 TaxID=1798507 RepID=A0A1F6EMS0_9BACT|nr:MAG: 50S ribosomal protein L17 [Candidatus Kaiserbacteria bacterium RIFCSPHIGHO2_01_FULL_50_13]OGG74946.1 MAG: 50S ribosomal protein L17 [Candidatus Kaiserbacteria bacterium RIFCSPLOWO2_01_FULL_50_24]OGG81748.1 MAG: 50S ribosomal protein L17 [Candidatus Kaiserbacteria bacterium RIFCSPLOWO2_02_FULL_51_13]
MRHHNKNRILGRTKRQRTALLRGLARSLVLHGAIVTTEAKAKELRPFIERVVTDGKKKTLASRRSVTTKLASSREATQKLYETYATRFINRAGGYTRIVKLGTQGKRVGEMARIEFV